ncbi:MAG: septum formation initiator family protein [Patescibacteria group bacterium]|nr:septum formation initiator family protein [Patescibacteria group bacterium]
MLKIKKIILLFLFIFFVFSLVPNIINHKNKIDFYEKIKKEYENEKKKNIELKTKIAKQKSAYEIEKNIRNNLNLTRENEVIIIFPSIKINPSPTQTPVLKNWEKWFEIFFK